MGKVIVRSIMFISSYFPLYIFLCILQYKSFCNLYNAFKVCNFGEIKSYEIIFCVLIILFILVSILSIILLREDSHNVFKVNEVKRANDDVISYVFTYIIPILSFSLDKVPTILVNGLLFLLIWFLYIKLNLMYLNPLWALFGYISYESDRGYIISDMLIDEIKRKKGKSLYGHYIANGIFVAKRKYNKN